MKWSLKGHKSLVENAVRETHELTIFVTGIFTTDGQLWHTSRQLIRPQFVKDRLSDIDIFEEHTQVLISKIEQSPEIDTLDLMFRYTLDAATHFLLGQSVGSLEEPKTVFADAFSNAQRVQSIVARVGYVGLGIHRMYR